MTFYFLNSSNSSFSEVILRQSRNINSVPLYSQKQKQKQTRKPENSKTFTMETTYKFRCDYPIDYNNLQEVCGEGMTDVVIIPQFAGDIPIPDLEVEFNSNLPYDELLRKFQSVDNATVAFNTLRPIAVYTGIQQYDKKLPTTKEKEVVVVPTKPKITLDNEFERLIAKLPQYIGKEIFRFLIPNQNTIEFRHCRDLMYECDYHYYGMKYEQAMFIDSSRLVANNIGIYLSRIPQKNGKSRYYLTNERTHYYCSSCGEEYCYSRGCRGTFSDKQVTFDSVYVGKDTENALYELFLELDIYRRKNTKTKKEEPPKPEQRERYYEDEDEYYGVW